MPSFSIPPAVGACCHCCGSYLYSDSQFTSRIHSVIKRGFPFQNNPKDLDSLCTTDLDLWEFLMEKPDL